MAKKKIFYDDGRVVVTNSTVSVDGAVYAVSGITSVSIAPDNSRNAAIVSAFLFVGMIAAVALCVPFYGNLAASAILLFTIPTGSLVLAFLFSSYAVVVRMSSGKRKIIRSKPSNLEDIADSITEAISDREQD